MFLHYILLFYRNIIRYKRTFLINLIGLSSGLVTVLLIYLWVSDELSIDKFHAYNSRLCQVMYNEKTAEGIKTSRQTPYFLEDALLHDIPEIELTSVSTPPLFFPDFVISSGEQKIKATGKFSGKNFFRMFSYPLQEGIPEQVLSDKNSVVISESLARKLYHSTENISGKTFRYSLMNRDKQVIVSGVFKDIPSNASERFDFVLSFDSMKDLMGMPTDNYAWNRTDPFYNYVLLREGVDVAALNKKLRNYIAKKGGDAPFSLFLKPYADNYLYNHYENGKLAGGRIDYIILFTITGLAILLIACINFINLSTAQADTKLKQIGIKKIVGATRKSLLFECFTDTICLSFFSLIVALLAAGLLLPHFNTLTEKHLQFLFTGESVVAMVCIVLLTGIFAGVYPAVYLSGFQPFRVLNGKNPAFSTSILMRRALVIFQFTLSVVFIISVLVIYRQVNFIQSKNLGYTREHLLFMDADGSIANHVDGFLNEIKKFNGVAGASSMIGSMTGETNGLPGFVEYNHKKITIYTMGVNYDMLETLGIRIMQGRSFSRALDHEQGNARWILNETAAQAMGEQSLVGKVIGNREIIGVVKDFHFQSLHEKIKPFAFYLEPREALSIWVRVQDGKEKEVIAYLNKVYAKFNSGMPFNFNFVEQAYKTQYVAENRISVLAKYFAVIAIVISCLGLIGLAAFTAERRKKEIGIRKILGCSEAAIIRMLSADLIKTVLVGITVAVPVSYFISIQWLNSFAYAIELQWWYFSIGGGTALLITWLTVSTFAMKAAHANPVESLSAND